MICTQSSHVHIITCKLDRFVLTSLILSVVNSGVVGKIVLLRRQEGEQFWGARCGQTQRVRASEIFRFFFTFDAKSKVLLVVKRAVKSQKSQLTYSFKLEWVAGKSFLIGVSTQLLL